MSRILSAIKITTVLLLVAMPARFFCQALATTVTPSGFCYNSGSNTGQAGVTVPAPGAGISYSWTIVSPSGVGSSATYTLAQVSGALINISYNGCGIFTVNCTALNNNLPVDQTTNTVSVSCLSITASNLSVCSNNSVMLTATGGTNYWWAGSTFVNPVFQSTISVLPGTYTLSGSSISGNCSETITINSLPPLNVLITPSAFTTCVTSNSPALTKSLTLVASGANTYSWTSVPPSTIFPLSDSIAVTPSVSTCYFVTGTTPICSNTGSVCVTVIPQFTIQATYSPIQVCRLQKMVINVTNTGTPAIGPDSLYNYSWKYSSYPQPIQLFSGVPTKTIYPWYSGTLTIEVQDAQSCISAPWQGIYWVAICDPLFNGIEELASGASLFAFYPSPVQSLLFMKTNTTLPDAVQIEVWDVAGRLVLVKQPLYHAQEDAYSVDLQDLKPGLYHITVNSEGQKLQVSKLVKTD